MKKSTSKPTERAGKHPAKRPVRRSRRKGGGDIEKIEPEPPPPADPDQRLPDPKDTRGS